MGFTEWLIIEIVLIAGIITCMLIRRSRPCESRRDNAPVCSRDDKSEMTQLAKMRRSSLSEPLSEHVRPKSMGEVIGQQDGIMALRAALCGSNPQHVIIYGPPGVGKTCAARLVLEEAKASAASPFNENSAFIEIDATCVRFDERSIADPLLGSVHDPIYQGAGSLGQAGIPQPKAGAVSRAHCGVLFLDEIGELHPMQMNKLLKVLEDRRVFFESSYYSKNNQAIPPYIHDIFQNGMPADFRLIGATTRSPEELPDALRSRCVELYFSSLCDEDLVMIARNAAASIGGEITDGAVREAALYSRSGRDAVNIIELAKGIAALEKRCSIDEGDIAWVARTCRYIKKYHYTMNDVPRAGTCFGLGVAQGEGAVFEIECSVREKRAVTGSVDICGAVAEEEIDAGGRKLKRKSTVMASVINAVSAVENCFGVDCSHYDILFNIVGGAPVDGPSAGAAFCLALMSAMSGIAPVKKLALTGEVSLMGEIHAVGGIAQKIEAARAAGAQCVIIPRENNERIDCDATLRVVSNVTELINIALYESIATPDTEDNGIIAALSLNEAT